MRVTKILALLSACALLCGCTNRVPAESSGGLFVGIEPAQESAEQAKFTSPFRIPTKATAH